MKRPERILLLCAGGVAVASPLALSHVWLVYNGVHFKGPKVDFGAPPSRYALWASYGGMDTYPAWRPGTTYLMEGIDETGAASQRRQNKIQAVYKKAIGREQEGDFQGALRIWKSAFHRGIGDPWISRERIALLKEVASRGNVQGLSSFLDATSPVVDQRPLPPLSQVDVAIKPYVLYESASRDADGVASAGQLMAVASAYP
ncbi:MAG TPA: hypothetical protein VG944_11290, partial [Fimbriimonas sp.]|nr:hypothetical protein [Fimbriimonas sp.]